VLGLAKKQVNKMGQFKNENIGIGGVFEFEIIDKKTGFVTERIKSQNMWLDGGLNLARDAVWNNSGGSIAWLGLGAGSLAVSGNDTGLESELNRAAISSYTTSGTGYKKGLSTFVFDNANGEVAEVAAFTAATGGTCICRSVLTSPFTNDNSKEVRAYYSTTFMRSGT